MRFRSGSARAESRNSSARNPDACRSRRNSGPAFPRRLTRCARDHWFAIVASPDAGISRLFMTRGALEPAISPLSHRDFGDSRSPGWYYPQKRTFVNITDMVEPHDTRPDNHAGRRRQLGNGGLVVSGAPSEIVPQRERRSRLRFRIEQEVEYRVSGSTAAGKGRTVNISSSGVLMTTETAMLPHCLVQLSIDWPAALNQTCPMQLVIIGPVVRSEAGTTAISIISYEFRTRRSDGSLGAREWTKKLCFLPHRV